ncbi:MAG: hypothetical protein ACYSSI_09880 [Planctomycetota bacterium]|jgi:hypothetical protein
MADNLRNTETMTSQLMDKLGADKKKTVIAIGLIVIMAFMWIRMFTGREPKSAMAVVGSQKIMDQQDEDASGMVFVELPYSKGRHDVLTRDFFAVGKGLDIDSKSSEVSVNKGQEHLKGVTNKLKLEAISFGENPQVFINNKLLSQGDKLSVEYGGKSYECKIAKIEENRVFVKCEETEIILKLLQLTEVTN